MIGRDATGRLIAAGCRRSVYCGSVSNIVAQEGRSAGYRQALDEAGIPFDPALIISVEEGTDADARASRMLDDLKPDGVFCFNDVRAPAVYAAARTRGLQIGQDLAVVGVDNQPFVASVLRPGLTTVELPHYEMGFEGVMRVVSMIDGPEAVSGLHPDRSGDNVGGDFLERTETTAAGGAPSIGLHCRLLDKGSVPPVSR